MTDISVNGLVKSFELGKNILDGLSFDITEGERVGILGHNGCGKTTLFRILVGEIDYDEGNVSVANGKRIGLISQIPVYPPDWTTEDVLKDAHRALYRISTGLRSWQRRWRQTRPNRFCVNTIVYRRITAGSAATRWRPIATVSQTVSIFRSTCVSRFSIHCPEANAQE